MIIYKFSLRFRFLSILIFVALLLSSCTERYGFKLDNVAPRLVITGYVCTEPGQYAINLSKSGGYFDSDNLRDVPSADVFINGEKLTPNDTLPCQYLTRTNFCAKSGETYKLEVHIDFNGDGKKEVFTAEALAPNTVDLLDAYIMSVSNKPEDSLFPFTTLVLFIDPGDVPYNYGAHLNLITARDSLDKYTNYRISNTSGRYTTNMFDPEVVKGKAVVYPAYIISRRLLRSPLDTLIVYPEDTLIVELNCHSDEYYNFLRNCDDSSGGSNPFFMTPAGPVSGNINGGAVGAFGVYTISRKRIVVPFKENTWKDEDMVKRFGYKWREKFPEAKE